MESKHTLRVKNLPIVIKKGNVSFLKGTSNFQNAERPFTPSVKISSLFKEDVLYDTTDVYYLKGEYQRMTLAHRMNVVTKVSRTIAKYYSKDGSVLEKTSDGVTQVIGQEQYRTIFTALCSILDQELKIRSILALLTTKVKSECFNDSPKVFLDKYSQTPEMRIEQLKSKPRRRVRKQPGPYVVQDNILPDNKKCKKFVVNFLKPCQVEGNNLDSTLTEKDNISVSSENSNLNLVSTDSTKLKQQLTKEGSDTVKIVSSKRNSTESLLDLGSLQDDISVCSSTGGLSALSDTSLTESYTNRLLNNVDHYTEKIENYFEQPFTEVQLMDGTPVILPYKPEDVFHIATKENLKYLDPYSRKKLLAHQMMIDYNHCIKVMDEDGNLPIHLSVLNNDLELLSRQCVVLKVRGECVDIPTRAGLTALQVSLYQASCSPALTECLLRHGADPLWTDDGHRACAHVAAERDADRLRVALNACRDNARRILSENEGLWKPEMEKQTDAELAPVLMKHMCSMFDKQGYTPLMLASMLGLYENVRVLLEHSPSSVNDKMPTCGNTALYLAVAAACNSSSERGNKSKVVDHFRRTIEILLENGADPAIDNHCGTNVNVLLTEFNCAEMSMLIANKLTQVHIKNNQATETVNNCLKLMLVKDQEGKFEYQTLENENKKRSEKKKALREIAKSQKVIDKMPEVFDRKKYIEKMPEVFDTKKAIDNKPVIIENRLLKSPVKTNVVINTKSQLVEPAKIKLQDIVLTGKKQRNPPAVLKNTNLVALENVAAPKNDGKLKRKMAVEPKEIKQAKIAK